MQFIIWLVTAALVLDCVLLILLVLIQLPKKDAGIGLAFGAGAADALFGAGSGNVLTKVTKYAAIGFFVLCLGLGILVQRYSRRPITDFEKALKKESSSLPITTPTTLPATPPATTSAPAARPATPITLTATNIPVAAPKPATNVPGK